MDKVEGAAGIVPEFRVSRTISAHEELLSGGDLKSYDSGYCKAEKYIQSNSSSSVVYIERSGILGEQAGLDSHTFSNSI